MSTAGIRARAENDAYLNSAADYGHLVQNDVAALLDRIDELEAAIQEACQWCDRNGQKHTAGVCKRRYYDPPGSNATIPCPLYKYRRGET